jgi:hypothetical protein
MSTWATTDLGAGVISPSIVAVHAGSAIAGIGEVSICTQSAAITLPSAPPNNTINRVCAQSANVVNIYPGGADTLNVAGSTTSPVAIASKTQALIYQASTATWYGF